jgi:hypothetical protein
VINGADGVAIQALAMQTTILVNSMTRETFMHDARVQTE